MARIIMKSAVIEPFELVPGFKVKIKKTTEKVTVVTLFDLSRQRPFWNSVESKTEETLDKVEFKEEISRGVMIFRTDRLNLVLKALTSSASLLQ